MRVVHIVNSIDPADGGPPAAAVRLAAAQARVGASVSILTRHPGSRLEQVNESIRGIPGIELLQLHFAAATLQIPRLLSRPDPEFVHIHGLWQPTVLMPAWQSMLRGVAFAVTPHGMLTRWSLQQKAWKKRLALHTVWRMPLAAASFVHALNEAEAADIRYLDMPCRIEIVPNGINTEELSVVPPPVESGSIAMPLTDRRYVLFLGRLHAVKAPDLALSAFATIAARFPDVDMVIAGPDGGERRMLTQAIHSHGLQDRVRLAGPVYGANKAMLLQQAACLIQPSRHECQSLTLFEAMSVGVPLVLTPQCNLPEATAAGAAQVAGQDAHALGEALARYLSDEEFRRRSGDCARRLVDEKFRWSRIAAQLLELYSGPPALVSMSAIRAEDAS